MGRIKKKQIWFTDLSEDQTISVTGTGCALNCRHCNKKFLKPMSLIGARIKPNVKSILISGGCDKDGKVPILRFSNEIKKLKCKYKINAHVGLVSKEEAKIISSMVDVVSADFVTEPRIIKEIYKSEKKLDDYYESIRALQKNVSVFPHLTLGLWKGNISWEYDAIEMLIKKLGFRKIVFNVFITTPGTELAYQNPPPITQIEKYFWFLEKNYPLLDKRFGCMRPGGEYREKIDELALLSGFKVITKPGNKTVQLAQNLNYQIFWQNQCCIFQ